MMEAAGRWLVIFGLALAIVGALVWLVGRLTGGATFPGTLRVEVPGGQCVIPILGAILISIILTVVLNLVARLVNR